MLLIAANPLCGFTTSVVFCLGHALLKQCITNNIPNIISKNIGYENIKHSVVAKSRQYYLLFFKYTESCISNDSDPFHKFHNPCKLCYFK